MFELDHRSLAIRRAVAAPLIVIVPLIVAALGNVIGSVDVTETVDDHGHAVVPAHERGHDHEGDPVHGDETITSI